MYVGTHLLSVTESGDVSDGGEYGFEEHDLVECTPVSLGLSGTNVVVTCGRSQVVTLMPSGEVQTLLAYPGGRYIEHTCSDAMCVAAIEQGNGAYDKNIGLIRLPDVTKTFTMNPEPVYVGFRDANYARIESLITTAGILAVTRSLVWPSGDPDGVPRERLHGFLLRADDTVVDIDPLVEAEGVRNPRLATNGASVALAHRGFNEPPRLVALEADGQLREESVDLTTTPSLDVRLTAAPDGAYAVAFDQDDRLVLRMARLEPQGTPGGDDAAAGAGDGCGCTVPRGGTPLSGILAAAIGLGLLVRRRRARATHAE